MTRIFLFLLLCISSVHSSAQKLNYQLTQTIKAVSDTVPDYDFMDFSFKKTGKEVLILQKNHSNGYFFSSYSLDSNKRSNIFNLNISHSIKDFQFINDQLFYCYFPANLTRYNLKTNEEERLLQEVPGRRFSKMEMINDNFLLLYNLYPFHPYDGETKVYLYVYDLKKKGIADSLKIDFEGISLGNIVHHWLRVLNEKIFLVAPLTGFVQIYNSKLKLEDSYFLPLPGFDIKKNKGFIDFMDNERKSANEELLQIRESKGEKYIKENKVISSYYNKGTLMKRIDSLRENYRYIEKVFTDNDTTIIYTAYRPEYQMEFRDVYFFDPIKKEIKDSIIAWRCAPIKEGVIKYPENYFTIDLINSYLIEPFFFKGNVYTREIYPIELFEQGTKKELDKIYFQYSLKNPVVWTLLEYAIKK